MRTLQVYIEAKRLDLFKDEVISVTSKQQDIADLSKVFSDFSQSFTVPSTPNNDAIFQHFYNTDVDSTIDHNLRRDALIEIDLVTFRRGKIALEKSDIRDNQAYSYTITFYGDITALKDKFADDMLQDLSFINNVSHPYTGQEVQNRIEDGVTNYIMRYPLIAQRYLTYADGGVNDISTAPGAIKYTELAPAVRVSALFGAIQLRYNVTFSGTFLADKRFQNCFLYCMNENEFVYVSETFDWLMATGGETSFVMGTPITAPELYTDYFDLAENSLTFQYVPFQTAVPGAPGSLAYFALRHYVQINTYGLDVITSTYFIDVVLNGVVQITYESSQFTGNAIIADIANELNTINLDPQTYTFRVRASEQINISIEINYRQEWVYLDGLGIETEGINTYFGRPTTPLFIEANISPINYLPNMKVVDFFNGILKEFNLTCYGISEGVYQVEPLDDWYVKGAIVDITNYVDIKSIKVDILKLYKSISFKYQKSDNILNSFFRDTFTREYGDAVSTFEYDGGEYKIEVPFENMLMTRFTDTELQVGFTVDKDLQTYVPKPMLLYMYDNKPCDFQFYDGLTTSSVTTYLPFGQDVIVNGTDYSLNWNAEVSPLLNIVNQETLFKTYYASYLLNLYNLKNRRTTCKTNMPVSLLTGLRLNDRVIIRDRRYIIESMTSKLNSGDVDLVLINDFRPMIADGDTPGLPDTPVMPNEPLFPPANANCMEVRILFPKGVVQADITCSNVLVTISPTPIFKEQIIEVCLPENTNGITLIKTEDDADFINTEDTIRLRTENGFGTIYILIVTYTFANGTQAQNQIYIEQQP